jgi:hypothetical protein
VEDADIRRERIEKLLHELRYEVTRGIMEREIEEQFGFRFYVPVSHTIKDGMVLCEFIARPVTRGYMGGPPKLRLVGSEE